MGWICHVVPFHRSASGRHTRDRLTVIPTASHADGDTQDTPAKALHAAPAGLGIGWTRHLLPSHRSASVTPAPEALTLVPTATHELAAGHDTQFSCPVRTAGFGLGVIDQPGAEALTGTEALAGIAAAPASTTAARRTDTFAALRLIPSSRERRRAGVGQPANPAPATPAGHLVQNFMITPMIQSQVPAIPAVLSGRMEAHGAVPRPGWAGRGRARPGP